MDRRGAHAAVSTGIHSPRVVSAYSGASIQRVSRRPCMPYTLASGLLLVVATTPAATKRSAPRAACPIRRRCGAPRRPLRRVISRTIHSASPCRLLRARADLQQGQGTPAPMSEPLGQPASRTPASPFARETLSVLRSGAAARPPWGLPTAAGGSSCSAGRRCSNVAGALLPRAGACAHSRRFLERRGAQKTARAGTCRPLPHAKPWLYH